MGQWEFLGLSSERLRDWMCVLLLFSLSLCLVPAHAAGQTDAALNAPASGSLGSLEGFLSHPPERRIESDNEVRNKPVHLSPGIQAGLNFATFGGDDTDLFREALQGVPGASAADEGRRTGFTAGVFLVADFRGLLALQPELRFIQKGYQIASSVRLGEELVPVTATIKIDYVEVPLLVRLDVPTAGPVSPHVLVGPTFGSTVNAAAEVKLEGESQTVDIGDGVGGTDLGLEFGAGVDVEIDAGTAILDARFGFGLSNIPSIANLSVKNRGVMVTAGFVF